MKRENEWNVSVPEVAAAETRVQGYNDTEADASIFQRSTLYASILWDSNSEDMIWRFKASLEPLHHTSLCCWVFWSFGDGK